MPRDHEDAAGEWYRAGGQIVTDCPSSAWLDGGANNNCGEMSSLQVPARTSRSRSRVGVAFHGASAVAQRRKTEVAWRPMRPSTVLGPNSSRVLSLRRDEQVTVHIHVVFLKIGEIDTVKEKYAADVFIQARWREPQFDEQPDLKIDEISWSKYWNPQLYVDNVVGEPKETIWRTVMWKNRKEAFVFERRRVDGVFVENLDLCQFPFDTQDLTLSLVSERKARELTLVEDSGELSTVNVQSFVNEQEWRLYNNVETQQETVTRIYQDDESTHPSFTAVCHASRHFGFYFWNILFVMFFICSMTFACFAVVTTNNADRLMLTFVLLLTTVTFKFAVNQSLPKISYLTYMDVYILSSLVLMCLVCVWHAVILYIQLDISTLEVIDDYVLAGFAGIYVLAHIGFFVYIYVTAIRPRNSHVEQEREHLTKRHEATLRYQLQQQHQQPYPNQHDGGGGERRSTKLFNNIVHFEPDNVTTNI